MARYFKNYEEVERALNTPLTPEQRELVGIYLFTGQRPDPKGCWTCTPAYVRKITGEIDRYENDIAEGRRPWPLEVREIGD